MDHISGEYSPLGERRPRPSLAGILTSGGCFHFFLLGFSPSRNRVQPENRPSDLSEYPHFYLEGHPEPWTLVLHPAFQNNKEELEEDSGCCGRFWSHGLGQTLHQHTDLIQSWTITGIDAFYVLFKLAKNIPHWIQEIPYVTLNFVGLISINFSLSLLKKTWHSLQLATQVGGCATGTLAFLQGTYIATGVGLTGALFLASIFSFFGREDLEDDIFAVTRPVGFVSDCLGIFLDVAFFFMIWVVLRQMAHLREEDNYDRISEALEVVRCHKTKQEIPLNIEPQTKTLVSRWHLCADKYTLKRLEEKLVELPERVDFATAKEIIETMGANTRTQFQVEVATLALQALGWGSILISDLFPDTLFQALVFFGMSLLYSGKLTYKKVEQYGQRQRLQALQTPPGEEEKHLQGPRTVGAANPTIQELGS